MKKLKMKLLGKRVIMNNHNSIKAVLKCRGCPAEDLEECIMYYGEGLCRKYWSDNDE